jgi:hypothetical protein
MVPTRIWLFRIIHIANLELILQRGGIHAPRVTPADGLPPYRVIHHQSIQTQRANKPVPCGPRGVIHDYVSFYFAPRSPMLYAIYKGNVQNYDEGQGPIIYLVSDAQNVRSSGARFVFTDGHAIMAMSEFFDDLSRLERVDWSVMRAKMWNDTDRSPDRKRRRQAEFMIHRFCPWPLIRGIAVINNRMQRQVESVLDRFPRLHRPVVRVKRAWYY